AAIGMNVHRSIRAWQIASRDHRDANSSRVAAIFDSEFGSPAPNASRTRVVRDRAVQDSLRDRRRQVVDLDRNAENKLWKRARDATKQNGGHGCDDDKTLFHRMLPRMRSCGVVPAAAWYKGCVVDVGSTTETSGACILPGGL